MGRARRTGKKLNTGKHLNRSRAGNSLVVAFLVLLGAFSFLPFYYAIVQSIKPVGELFAFPPRFYAVRPTLENYAMVGKLTGYSTLPLSRFVFNSVFVSAVVTAAHVLLASMAAFPLAKYKFPGSKLISSIVVLALLFSAEVTRLPQYVVISSLGLVNTYWAVILPAVASSLGLFLMKQFMEVIPDSLLEAARIDGAGTFRTYWSVAMPQAKPAWVTLTLFAFQGIWGNTGSGFIFSSQLKMLPTILGQITSGGVSRAGAAAAVAVMLMAPPMAIFFLSQSQIIETMAYSGIKE